MVTTEHGNAQDVPSIDLANQHMIEAGLRPFSWGLATVQRPGQPMSVALTLRTETTTTCVQMTRDDAVRLATALATTSRQASGLIVPVTL